MPGRGHRLPAARAIVAASAAAIALLTAGCDSHSKPQAVEDLTSSAPLVTTGPSRAAVSPTVAASTEGTGRSPGTSSLPSAEDEIPAAVQVVQTFFDGLNYEIDNKGDESRAAAVFSPDCVNCASSVSKIHDLFTGGHSLRGGHYRVISIDRSYATDQTHVAIEITDSADAGQQIDSNGNVTRQFPGASPTRLIFYVIVSPAPPKIGSYFLKEPS